ncbi:MAG: FHA domain-containing protein [Alloprevotella sp.]
MKKLRCPKCDEAILFDETRYEPGRSLVFECPACRKQFKIRMPAAPKAAQGPTETPEEEVEAPVLATLVVVENVFHLKQEIPIYEGENIVGRHVRGTKANAAIKTVDPSVDTTHCVITAKVSPNGVPVFTLRDAPSNTGTFLGTHLLGVRETARLEDGSIVTIGATTLIFRTEEAE